MLFRLEAVQQPSRKAVFAGVLFWQVLGGEGKPVWGTGAAAQAPSAPLASSDFF